HSLRSSAVRSSDRTQVPPDSARDLCGLAHLLAGARADHNDRGGPMREPSRGGQCVGARDFAPPPREAPLSPALRSIAVRPKTCGAFSLRRGRAQDATADRQASAISRLTLAAASSCVKWPVSGTISSRAAGTCCLIRSNHASVWPALSGTRFPSALIVVLWIAVSGTRTAASALSMCSASQRTIESQAAIAVSAG